MPLIVDHLDYRGKTLKSQDRDTIRIWLDEYMLNQQHTVSDISHRESKRTFKVSYIPYEFILQLTKCLHKFSANREKQCTNG